MIKSFSKGVTKVFGKILIITGGTFEEEFVKNYIASMVFDQIIVVDGGLKFAHQLGLNVNYIVGDFDTVSKDLLEQYKEEKNGVKPTVYEYNPEKDATDTQIAVELGIKLKPEEIIMLAATGTRLDHTLANINLLKQAVDRKIRASIINEKNKIYLIDSTCILKRKQTHGTYLSLIPFTDFVDGVTLKGFKYPLTNKKIIKGDSLGVSNQIIDDEATIEISSGILTVIEAKD